MDAEYKTKAKPPERLAEAITKDIFQGITELSQICSLKEHTSFEGVLFIFNVLKQKIVWPPQGKTAPNTVTAVSKRMIPFFACAILQTNNGTFCVKAVWN